MHLYLRFAGKLKGSRQGSLKHFACGAQVIACHPFHKPHLLVRKTGFIVQQFQQVFGFEIRRLVVQAHNYARKYFSSTKRHNNTLQGPDGIAKVFRNGIGKQPAYGNRQQDFGKKVGSTGHKFG